MSLESPRLSQPVLCNVETPPQNAKNEFNSTAVGLDDQCHWGDTDSAALCYTRSDQKDMQRMGKIPQLRRNFPRISLISFICVMVSTWEVLFLANSQGLADGGLAGLFWSYLWTFLGFALIAASLAEMASMAPTSGGMYHWVSEFAPPQYQRFLSYMTGWSFVSCPSRASVLGVVDL